MPSCACPAPAAFLTSACLAVCLSGRTRRRWARSVGLQRPTAWRVDYGRAPPITAPPDRNDLRPWPNPPFSLAAHRFRAQRRRLSFESNQRCLVVRSALRWIFRFLVARLDPPGDWRRAFLLERRRDGCGVRPRRTVSVPAPRSKHYLRSALPPSAPQRYLLQGPVRAPSSLLVRRDRRPGRQGIRCQRQRRVLVYLSWCCAAARPGGSLPTTEAT